MEIPNQRRPRHSPAAAVQLAALLCLLLALPGRAAERQVLHGHVPTVVSQLGLAPVGRLDAAQRMHLGIALPLRNQPELTVFLHQLADPASPNYRHYLTPAQFAARFGPTPQDYEAVAAFADARGLTVTTRYTNRLVLDVGGAVSDIEKALHVTMRVYRHPTEGRTFYAPDVEPSLDLAVPIAHISGLDNYGLPKPRAHPVPASRGAVAAPNTGSGPGGTYMGNDFRAAYAPNVTLNGSGQSVGLLEFDGYTASDITYYETKAGLPNVTLTNELLDGYNGKPTNTDGPVEVSLDIEVAISMAQGLTQVIVYEAGPDGDWHDILNQMASDDSANQLSCSWYIPGGTADSVADGIFQEMSAQGQSFFSASGDSDAYTGLIPFPGDTPYITEVGGTTLTESGTGGPWSAETVWNWGLDQGSYVGSSGGISTQYAIPTWQQGINMTSAQGSSTMRNVPDVAMTADNVDVREGGQNNDEGGTSCAAPLWAGFAALVNQQAAAEGQNPVGFINPAIYAIATGPGYNSAFHDITTGNNFSSSSPSKFAAVTGYDLCTGVGTPAGQALINALTVPVDSLELSAASTFASSGPVGGPFAPNASNYTVTDAGASTMTWSASATQSWLSLSATSGTLAASGSLAVTASINANANTLVAGTYTDTITFTDIATGYTQTRGVVLNVVAAPVITGALTATAGNNAGFTYQIGATNNPASYMAGPLPLGLTVNTATGRISGTTTATGTTNVTISAINLGGTGSATLALTVLPPAPAITSVLSATATNNVGFTYQIVATNNPASYMAGPLPLGLTVNTATGLISGTTTATGASNVTISAINTGGTTSAILKLTVLPPPPAINSALVATASNNVGFTYQITATNNPTGFGASGLPSGLTVNGATGLISGTTTATGTDDVTISAVNAGGTGSAVLVLTVPPPPPPPVIDSTLSAKATIGIAFNYQINATNNPTSYGTTVLPAGLGLNTATGVISGTATATGTTNVTISAVNAGGTGSAILALSVVPPPPVITSALAALASIGEPFAYSITATNSPGSYNATELPAGLGINTATGLISGTATTSSTSNVTISAINAGGTGSATLVVTVLYASPPVILSGSFTTLCSFTGTNGAYPGAVPAAPLLASGSGFYGTTQSGGSSNDGTIFDISNQGVLESLISFTGARGANPDAPLIQGAGGKLLGTAASGGSSGDGTVFSASSGAVSTLAIFTGSNGSAPSAGLVSGGGGTYYGTTSEGGSANEGTVFTITSSGSLTTLCSFTGTNGSEPSAGLISGTNGNYYGTTALGGSANQGTVFMITSSGSLTTLCSFTGTNGSYPLAGLVQGSDGNLYGTTYQGGNAGYGTVFQLTTSGSLNTLCSFSGILGPNPGQGPDGTFIQGSDGSFYGTTYLGGTGNAGTLFKITSGGTLTTLYMFGDENDGGYPAAGLVQSGTGAFYGTASGGGANGMGTVFQWAPSAMATGTQGTAFSYQIAATNSPTSYNAAGLPAGLGVNTATGLISGAPSGSGTASVTVSAANIGGTGSAILTVVIQAPVPPPVITSGTSVTALVGQPFTYQISASNNPTSYNAIGLPVGFSMNTSTGLISGTWSAPGSNGITISAANTSGTGTAVLTVVVQTPYGEWQREVFSPSNLAEPGISGDTADPAGDGIPNLMKYALNLNPFVNGLSGLPVQSVTTSGTNKYLTLNYTKVVSATDVTYTVQVSTDLQNWNSGTAYTTPPNAIVNPGGLTDSVTVESVTPINAKAPKQYIRLQVTGP